MKKYNKIIIILICLTIMFIGVCFIPINASKLIPIIEKQVKNELGVNIHIDKLVLRVGPFIKIKTPIMHILYEDGQKFAQFDNVRFYISLASVFKDNPNLHKIRANKLQLRFNSDDKYLADLLNKIENKNYETTPALSFKEYKLTYNNKEKKDIYTVEGQDLVLKKLNKIKNYKLKTNGVFKINESKYISYDVLLNPNFDLVKTNKTYDFIEIIEQIKQLDFKADVISDLKLYKNNLGVIQGSGYINIDNISVLDLHKKEPKSFVYLTLWGDKTSILSNIYTSQNKKIYLEGIVNNSQKPVIDIKVKTDNIELNDLYKKIRVLACFSKFKNINDLNGILNANFVLKGDLNKIKSNGFLKITNASVKSNCINIEKINTEINLNNNVIEILNSSGYVKNSPIFLKGKIDKDIDLELLMNRVELKHLCPDFWGIKSGVISLVANFSGSLQNIIHKENIFIEDLKIFNKNVELSFNSLKYDTNKNNLAVVENLILINNFTENIKLPTLKFNIDKDYIKIPSTNIYLPNSQLALKGELTDFKNLVFNTNLTGFINSKDIKSFNNNSIKLPLKLNINGNKAIQNINSQILFENSLILEEPFVINLDSKLEKNLLKIDDLSVSSYNNKDFKDCKITTKTPKKIIITGNIEDFKTPSFKNIRIFVPQAVNIHLMDYFTLLKGDLFVNGKYNKPELIGQITIQNLLNQDMQLSISNATLDFNKNNIFVNIPAFKIMDSSVNLLANISTDISKGILINNANVKSKYLNVDTFLMYKDNLISNIPIEIRNTKLYTEKLHINLYNNPIYLSAITADFTLINNIVNFKNIMAEVYNGKISGNIDFNLKDELFTTSLMARSVSATPLFDIVSNRDETISGSMDFDAQIKGGLTSKQTLDGNIKFIVNNGRMSTLGKLEHLLYAQNVVADNMLRTSLSVVTKAITLKDTGLFKYLRGDIDIKNGIANINMLQSLGPLMSLYIKGSYNTINDYAQLVILGRLSDEIITGLGAFGDFSLNKLMIMLTGEDNNYNIKPEDFDKIPQLTMKNTKEFRSIINGNINKVSSVILFNWISYSQKTLKQKDVPITKFNVPQFVDDLPY